MLNAMLLYYYLYYLNNFNVIFVELHFILYYFPFIYPSFFYYFPAQLLAQAKNCCNKLVNPTKKDCTAFYIFHIFSLQLRLQCRMNVFP